LSQAEGQPFGKYQLLERIAAGGMAEIYKARYEGAAGITKPVVIKKILPHYAGNKSFVSMFVNEAKIAVGLSHGNIAQIFDFGEVDGEFFLAMEYVPGHPLSRVLRKSKQLLLSTMPVPLALPLAIEVLKGLHYAHTRIDEYGRPLNIVHRDVSPQNVMISYEGQVKLVDFGIAKARHATAPETQAGAVKGKYVYFAPEQARGKDLDARTDIFAVGTLLYEMLCGRLPFEGKMIDVLSRVVRCEFPRPRTVNPDISPALESLILGAMTLEKKDRFQTAQVFQESLSAYLYAHSPTPVSTSLAAMMNFLFEDELREEGQPVNVPPEFRDQVVSWKRRQSKETEPDARIHSHPSLRAAKGRPTPPPSSTQVPTQYLRRNSSDAVSTGAGTGSGLGTGTGVGHRAPPKWLFVAAPLIAMAACALLVFAVGHFGTFTIHLTSVPTGAVVQLDDDETPRTTPVVLTDLSASHTHRIRLTAPGMKTLVKMIDPVRGEVLRVPLVMEPERKIVPQNPPPHGPQKLSLDGRGNGFGVPPARAARLRLDRGKKYSLWVEPPAATGTGRAPQVFFMVEGPQGSMTLGQVGVTPKEIREASALHLFLLGATEEASTESGLTVRLRELPSGSGTTLLLDAKANAVALPPESAGGIAHLDPAERYTLTLKGEGRLQAACLSGPEPLQPTESRILETGTSEELTGTAWLRCALPQDLASSSTVTGLLEITPVGLATAPAKAP
jgi:eukaryotic-like serine/threonine-protein kinase